MCARARARTEKILHLGSPTRPDGHKMRGRTQLFPDSGQGPPHKCFRRTDSNFISAWTCKHSSEVEGTGAHRSGGRRGANRSRLLFSVFAVFPRACRRRLMPVRAHLLSCCLAVSLSCERFHSLTGWHVVLAPVAARPPRVGPKGQRDPRCPQGSSNLEGGVRQ